MVLYHFHEWDLEEKCALVFKSQSDLFFPPFKPFLSQPLREKSTRCKCVWLGVENHQQGCNCIWLNNWQWLREQFNAHFNWGCIKWHGMKEITDHKLVAVKAKEARNSLKPANLMGLKQFYFLFVECLIATDPIDWQLESLVIASVCSWTRNKK